VVCASRLSRRAIASSFSRRGVRTRDRALAARRLFEHCDQLTFAQIKLHYITLRRWTFPDGDAPWGVLCDAPTRLCAAAAHLTIAVRPSARSSPLAPLTIAGDISTDGGRRCERPHGGARRNVEGARRNMKP
jgi:hypothetical protein